MSWLSSNLGTIGGLIGGAIGGPGGAAVGGMIGTGLQGGGRAVSGAPPVLMSPPPMSGGLDTLAGLRLGPLAVNLTQQKSTAVASAPGGVASFGGWHLDRYGRQVPNGYIINRRGKYQRKARMNVANGCALKRALRRVHGFEKIARSVLKVAPKFKKKPHFPARRRRTQRAA